MLITFKSKAAADVLMYEVHAKPLLDILHKELGRGVLTPEEVPAAIDSLEAHIAGDQAQASSEPENDYPDEPIHPSQVTVALSARAFPLLEMLRAARKSGAGVMWGV